MRVTLEARSDLALVATQRKGKVQPQDAPDLTFIGLEHVEPHTMKLLGQQHFGEMRSAGNVFRRGDVLYSRLRPYLNKVVVARSDGACSGEFIVLEPKEGVSSDLLAYRLNATDFVEFAKSLNAGDRPRVDWGEISAFPAVLPTSIQEQIALAAHLDLQFSRLDAAIGALKRAQENLKRYRASVLQAAVTGRLVPTEHELAEAEGRDYETGPQLLTRILAERKAAWTGKGKYKEPACIAEALPVDMPPGWTQCSIGQAGEVVTGTTPPTTDRSHYAGQVAFFKPTDLDAGYYTRASRETLSNAGAAKCRLLPENSVLVTCIGATIGKTGLARVPCATNQQINAVSCYQGGVLPEFLFWSLTSPMGQKSIVENASATTLPILNKSKFATLAMPLPPLAEQVRIVAEVERRLSVADQMESILTASLTRATRLRQAILKEAFRA